MKRKLVPENIEELNEWYSTDTGAHLYAEPEQGDTELAELSEDDILDLVPPSDFKFDKSSFNAFVNELIQAIPENPYAIIKIFSKTLEKHPYLTQRSVGFKRENEFAPMITKFKEALNSV